MPSIINSTTTNGIVVSGDNSGSLQLASNNGTTAVTIDGSQNVGIGTTSPSVKFHVDGTGNQYSRVSSSTHSNFIQAGCVSGNTFHEYKSVYRLVDTDAGERMRITSIGYTKISNDGTYINSDGTYHEFRQTAESVGIYQTATNGSLTNPMILQNATRSASDAYQFLRCYSNNGSDTEILLRGDGNGYADGTWNNNGADYAEYFESATGQVIPTGSTVVLENNKVRLATVTDNPDDVIGVVRPKEPSKASMVIGNTAWNKWANKYLTDDFDRYIMEDHDVVEWTDEDGKQHSYESHNVPASVIVPTDAVVKTHDDKGNKFQHYKLNPAWDKDFEYINRENRDEWLIIGLIGQVKVLKGQVVGDRWKKMRDVSESVEEWMIR